MAQSESSSAHELSEGGVLETSSDFAGGGVHLAGGGIDLIESELLLLAALEQVHFNGVVFVHMEPSAGVEELARVGLGVVVGAIGVDALNDEFARGQKHDSRRVRPVSNCDVALHGVDSKGAEAVAVLEQGAVGRSKGQLDLWQLGQHTEEAEVVLHDRHRALHVPCLHFN